MSPTLKPAYIPILIVAGACLQGVDMNWNPEVSGWCNTTSHGRWLQMDQACFTLGHVKNNNSENGAFELWGQSEKCLECPYWNLISLPADEVINVIVNTTYPSLFEIKQNNHSICNFTYHFGEFGSYALNFSHKHCSSVVVQKEPANIYLPLLWTFIALAIFSILWCFKCMLRDQQMLNSWYLAWLFGNNNNNDSPDSTLLITPDTSVLTPVQAVRHRIRCLDTLRGLTVFFMILVNYGGGGYWFLKHAPWNGLTLADIVFPCFVWMMGASCVLSLNSQLRRSLSRRRILYNVVRRSFFMFISGLVLNSLSNNDIRTLRVPGVLQRLSLTYLIVALAELIGFDPEDNHRYAWFASVRDVVCSWRQWLIVTILATAHLVMTFVIPVPGCPFGYLGAGGLEKGGVYYNCTGGAARMVDVTFFGESHIYQRPTTKGIYDTIVPFDPEGLLGVLTSVLTAYLGAQGAKILLVFPANNQRVPRWFMWFLLTGVLGSVLCSFRIDDGIIPINKNLWSLSFVFITSSIAFGLLIVLYITVDVLSWWSGAPFRYAGMNAFLLYIGHIVARPLIPFTWKPLASTHGAQFTMNFTAACIWLIISLVLYRKRVFLTL